MSTNLNHTRKVHWANQPTEQVHGSQQYRLDGKAFEVRRSPSGQFRTEPMIAPIYKVVSNGQTEDNELIMNGKSAEDKQKELEAVASNTAIGDSDVESVTSINSGLGAGRTEAQDFLNNDFQINYSDEDSDMDSDEEHLDVFHHTNLQTKQNKFFKHVEAIQAILDQSPVSKDTETNQEISDRIQVHALEIAAIFGDDVESLRQQLSDIKVHFLSKHDELEELQKKVPVFKDHLSHLDRGLAQSQKSRQELITCNFRLNTQYDIHAQQLLNVQNLAAHLRHQLLTAEEEHERWENIYALHVSRIGQLENTLEVTNEEHKKIIDGLVDQARTANTLHLNVVGALNKQFVETKTKQLQEIMQLKQLIEDQACFVKRLYTTGEKRDQAHEIFSTALMQTSEEAKAAHELEITTLKEQHAAQITEFESRYKRRQNRAAKIIFEHLDQIKKLEKKAVADEEDSVNEINTLKSELIYARAACHMAEKQHDEEEAVLKKRTEKSERRLARFQNEIEKFADEEC